MPPATTVFNPKILDASIRDVASYLSDNDKTDMLLYAVQKLTPDSGRIKTVIENAIQSCLSVSTLPLESKAVARVIRAKARLANGSTISGMEAHTALSPTLTPVVTPMAMAAVHSYHPRLHPNLFGGPFKGDDDDGGNDMDMDADARSPPSSSNRHGSMHPSAFDDTTDLQAALMADPDNAEAKAMLHARSQPLDKLLVPSSSSSTNTTSDAPAPQSFTYPFSRQLERISIEIWREIALFLPRRDLKTLLFVPHILSRVASQLLFRELDLHFTGGGEYGYSGGGESDDEGPSAHTHGHGHGHGGGSLLLQHHGHHHSYHRERDAGMDERERDEGRHAQRTADVLTRLIVDQKFANAVRTLKIYCSKSDRDGSMAFQTGMLTNVLPKLVNLKNMYLSAPSESIVPVLRILQTTGTRLLGLSLHSPDAPADLSFLELRNLSHFSYTTSGGALVCVTPLLNLSRHSLSSLHLENTHSSPSPHWTFPVTYVSIRNLTSLNFTGHFSKEQGAGIMGEILRDGRQLENLSVVCCALESGGLSREFKSASTGWSSSPGSGAGGAGMGMHQHVTMNSNGTPVALPFLTSFAFTIQAIGRRTADRELFGSIADFLRGRKRLRSLKLVVSCDEHVQSAVGFSAAVWGVLPSLEGLRGLSITYPGDLTAGLASWLVPRGVRALVLGLDYGNATARDPVPFLSSLKQGMPPELKFIGLSELNVRHPSLIVEQGFPTVRVVRVGQNYWTVHHRKYGSSGYSSLAASPPATHSVRPILPSMTSHGPGSSAGVPPSATPSSSSASTPRGALSPVTHLSDRTPDQRDREPQQAPPQPLQQPQTHHRLLMPSTSSSGEGSSRHAASEREAREHRLMQLRPLGTHTGHPHSGHTHGHPGSSNPHPPHGQAHLLNPAPPSGHGHGHADGNGSGARGAPGGGGASGSGSGGGGSGDGRGAGGGGGGYGGSHHASVMGPPMASAAGGSAHGGAGAGHSGGLMSSGILLGPGGAGAVHGMGGQAVVELEPWSRRTVLYHAAEWLEWLGCEDALVRDQSAFPAWVMCL